MDKHDTIGIDCVAMCVNDIICAGAEPLFFLDYIACGKNDPALLAQIVTGVADGCVQAGAALVGGETAEMPGMYPMTSTIWPASRWAWPKSPIVDGPRIAQGDVLIGLPSTGVHSNGFSLVRKALFEQAGYTVDTDWTSWAAKSWATCCSPPPRSTSRPSLPCSRRAWSRASPTSPAAAFIENIPRMIPDGLAARHPARLLARAPDLRRAGEGRQHRS